MFMVYTKIVKNKVGRPPKNKAEPSKVDLRADKDFDTGDSQLDEFASQSDDLGEDIREEESGYVDPRVVAKIIRDGQSRDEELDQLKSEVNALRLALSNQGEFRQYSDVLDIAVNRLGLQDYSQDIRARDPDALVKAVTAFSSQLSAIKRNRDAFNDMMRRGNEDLYTQARVELVDLIKEEGMGSDFMDFFELQEKMDTKRSLQESIGDLSSIMLIIYAWYSGVAIPAVIREEVTRYAKDKRVDEDGVLL